MNKLTKKCIDRVYVKKDYNYFRDKCNKTPSYLGELEELVYSMCIKFDIYCMEDEPAIEIWFDYEKYSEDRFIVEYRTLLKISKVADLFVFQHEFCVANRDPNRMTPVLDGFAEEPYNFSQNKLENMLTDFLECKNLVKLRLSEMDEVIMNFDIPMKSIFGEQMTVENALFRDLYGICDK